MNIGDLLYMSSHVSAYAAAAAAGLVAYGFVRLAIRRSGIVGHLSAGMVLMHVAAFLRMMYWDGLRIFLPESAWTTWYDLSGETSVNLLFNGLVVVAGYHSLKALRLAIPEDARGQYSLIGSVFYPEARPFRRLCEAMLAALRARGR